LRFIPVADRNEKNMEPPKDSGILKRTHTLGQLREADIGKAVRLCGWVRSYRDHGGVVFIDLRDRDGVTQVVFDLPKSGEAAGAALYDLARGLRNEWVISIGGVVRHRGEDRVNPKLPTGQVEVLGQDLVVLNRADTTPFSPDEYTLVSEETRLRYRYLDLRRPEMARALRLRHQIARAMRGVLDEAGFVEVETPFLTRSTPEGARDFLVPCRLRPGTFYALPQSPQLFKQLLMVGGMDRYYQIVRCFRDEDLRADRQPEFTQLDLEMSFVDEEDVMEITDRVFRAVCAAAGKEYPARVPRIPYRQAIDRYGIDRPDMRFEMLLADVSEIVRPCEFKVFSDALAGGGIVKAIAPPGGAKFSRKEIEAYTAVVAELGAKGLAWCKLENGSAAGGVAKFLPPDVQARLRETLGAKDGDILMFLADKASTVNKALAALRSRLGKDLGLCREDQFAWCWVTDFPLLEYSEQEKRWMAMHHPFTSTRPEDLPRLASDPGSVKARAYDIVLNGVELGGGSIRIHDPGVQRQVFAALGIDEAEAKEKFGFLLDAFRFGAPPHGGIALGLDRIAMMMIGGQSLRDVIAFPKTQRGVCALTNAPAAVTDEQLAELDLRVITPPKP
jgi:aspartyl-tRNA synthetase